MLTNSLKFSDTTKPEFFDLISFKVIKKSQKAVQIEAVFRTF